MCSNMPRSLSMSVVAVPRVLSRQVCDDLTDSVCT